MKDLGSLETMRLIKEAEYYSTELEYRSELVRLADSEFMAKVGEMLEEYPEIKKGVDAAISAAVSLAEAEGSEDSEREERDDSSPAMKKAFREVAKQTHPDTIGSERLSSIWLRAAKAYESRDLAAMCSICDSLGIPMELGEEDRLSLSSQIASCKERIAFIESTFSWNWMREQDPKRKESLLKEFIARKIR